MEQTTPQVYAAICKATKAIGQYGIGKDKKNEAQGYKFRGIDDCYNALNAVLAGAGLCVLPRMVSRVVEERTTKSGAPLFYVTVDAEYDFVAVEDGSKHTVKVFGEAMDSADKATNKAMSAAYKYCCMQTFCIPTEGMAEDADLHTPDPAPKTAPAPKPAPKAKPEPVVKHTPAQVASMEATLRASINDAIAKIQEKYYNIGQKGTFWSIMGSHGYESAAQIPADYEKAKPVIDELKDAFKKILPPAA